MSQQLTYTERANSKLKELLVEQLRDMYWVEKKLVKMLNKMHEAATNSQLKDAFGRHGEQTRNHIDRIEKIFDLISELPNSTKCPAMAGIIEEVHDIIDESEEGSCQRDAALIMAAQKAEHYEIATYGSLAQLAQTLGIYEIKDLLRQTLEEEKQTDAMFSLIAESGINYMAAKETV